MKMLISLSLIILNSGVMQEYLGAERGVEPFFFFNFAVGYQFIQFRVFGKDQLMVVAVYALSQFHSGNQL